MLAVGVALGVLTTAIVGVLWTVVSIGHHRVDAAADLAALSAAHAVQAGEADGCRAARRIAAAHVVELRGCRVEGETVSVVVAVRLRMGVLGAPVVSAEARAGPMGAD